MKTKPWTQCFATLFVGGAVACGGNVAAQSADPLPDAGTEAGADAPPDVPPGTWIEFDAQGFFTFRGPAYLKEEPVTGIDSYVGDYVSDDLIIGYDYGGYSDPLEFYDDYPEYEASSVVIDGKTAKLITMRKPEAPSGLTYVAAVHFPEVAGPGIKLTMWAEGRTTKEQQLALEIFDTIDFP